MVKIYECRLIKTDHKGNKIKSYRRQYESDCESLKTATGYVIEDVMDYIEEDLGHSVTAMKGEVNNGHYLIASKHGTHLFGWEVFVTDLTKNDH